MTGATWILVYKQPSDPAATGEALKFFAWAYKNGAKMAESLDYVPMPAKSSSKQISRALEATSRTPSGKPIF